MAKHHDFKYVQFDCPVFAAFERPNGFLCNHKTHLECHACFYYALTARQAYEEIELGYEIQYEDALWNQTNYRQQLDSVSVLYGISPDEIVKHFNCVDMQFTTMGFTPLPDEERFRFNKTPKVN